MGGLVLDEVIWSSWDFSGHSICAIMPCVEISKDLVAIYQIIIKSICIKFDIWAKGYELVGLE